MHFIPLCLCCIKKDIVLGTLAGFRFYRSLQEKSGFKNPLKIRESQSIIDIVASFTGQTKVHEYGNMNCSLAAKIK